MISFRDPSSLDASVEETYSYLLKQLETVVGFPLTLRRGKPAPAKAPTRPYWEDAGGPLIFPLRAAKHRNTYWEIVVSPTAAEDLLCRRAVGKFAAHWNRVIPEAKRSFDLRKTLIKDSALYWDNLILSLSARGAQKYNALQFVATLRRALLFRYEDKPVRLSVLMSWNLHTTINELLSKGCIVLDFAKRKLLLGEALSKSKGLNTLADGANSLIAADSHGYASSWISLPFPPDAVPEHWEMVPLQFRKLYSLLNGRDLICTAMPTGELYLFNKSYVFRWTHSGWRRISGPSIRNNLVRYLPEDAATAVTQLVVELAFARKGALVVVARNADDLLRNGSSGTDKVFTSKGLFNVQDSNLWCLIRFASMDGCMVLNSAGFIERAGVILNVPPEHTSVGEGARTAAASYGSTFGIAIKVSQDGPISVFESGKLMRSM